MLAAEYPEAVFGPVPSAFTGAFAFSTQPVMRAALSRAFHLARSLPSFPLAQFEAEVQMLGDTEVASLMRTCLHNNCAWKARVGRP